MRALRRPSFGSPVQHPFGLLQQDPGRLGIAQREVRIGHLETQPRRAPRVHPGDRRPQTHRSEQRRPTRLGLVAVQQQAGAGRFDDRVDGVLGEMCSIDHRDGEFEIACRHPPSRHDPSRAPPGTRGSAPPDRRTHRSRSSRRGSPRTARTLRRRRPAAIGRPPRNRGRPAAMGPRPAHWSRPSSRPLPSARCHAHRERRRVQHDSRRTTRPPSHPRTSDARCDPPIAALRRHFRSTPPANRPVRPVPGSVRSSRRRAGPAIS